MNNQIDNLNSGDIDPADRPAYLAWLAAEGLANETEQSEIHGLTATDSTFAAMIAAEQSFSRRLNNAAELPLADSLAELAAQTVQRQQRLRWVWRGAVAASSALAACLAVAFLLRTTTPTTTPTSPNTATGVLTVTGPLAEAAVGAPILDFAISAPAGLTARAPRIAPMLICTAAMPQPVYVIDADVN